MKKYTAVKMKNFNYYQFAALLGLTGQVLIFISEIFVARQLLPEDFGKFAVFVLLVEFIQIISFKSLALTHSIKNDISDYFLFLTLISSILISVILLYLIVFFDSYFLINIMPDVDLALVGAVVVCCIADYYLKLYFLKAQRYNFVSTIDFVSVCIYVSSLVLFVLKGYGWESFIYSYLLRFLFKALLYFAFIKSINKTLGRSFLRSDLNFSVGLTIQSVFLFSTSNVDKAIIVSKLGDASLGIYSRAQKLIYTPFEQIIRSTSNISFSKMNSSNTEGKELIFFNTFRLVLYTVMPLVLFTSFCSDFLVVEIYGNNWVEMANILPQISFIAFISLLSIPVGDFLKSNGVVYKETFLNLFAFSVFCLLVWLLSGALSLVMLSNILLAVNFSVLIFQLYQASKFFKMPAALRIVFDFKKLTCIAMIPVIILMFNGFIYSEYILGFAVGILTAFFFVNESARLKKI